MRHLLPLLGLVAAAGLAAAACGGEEESLPAATRTEGAMGTPAGATATVAAAPTATEPVHVPVWNLSQVTEQAQVITLLSDGADELQVASADEESAQFEYWNIVFDRDLDGDGVSEAVVSHYTGGAHCCSEYLIFRSTPDGIESVDSFSLGNGGIVDVGDLDGDGVAELQGYDDRLAYFDDLAYVATQMLPLSLCLSEQGAYVDCTPQFPDLLLSAAADFQEQLQAVVSSGEDQTRTWSLALALLASYSRVGMDDEGWGLVDAACPDCGDWLRQNQAELEERVTMTQPYREP